MASVMIRAIVSVLLLFVWRVVGAAVYGATTLASGELAGQQFQNSNAAYLRTQTGFPILSGPGLVLTIVALLILFAIWFRYIKMAYKYLMPAIVIVVLLSGSNAYAYYNKANYTEAIYILPNESAFWIPDTGANKDGQAKFGSKEYLETNRIPAKRFEIPHAKFSGSGYFTDYYVPTGRMIIIDRTPYNREWTSSHRGTTSKDESFPCQDSGGLNITVEVSIGVSVTEENSPTYLYHFGVKPPVGDRTTPEVIFTSVYYGRTLTEVMDTVGRGKVQALVCREVSRRSLDKANEEASFKVMEEIEKSTSAFLASRGITLDYIGWAGTFTLDHAVQDAINRRYVANKEAEIAQLLAPHTATIQALATADALRIFANKSDGKLPATVSLWWLPAGISDFLSNVFKSATQVPANK